MNSARNRAASTMLITERRAARTVQGVGTRVAQRLLALAAVVWHNWSTGLPSKRTLTAYDH